MKIEDIQVKVNYYYKGDSNIREVGD